MKRRNSLDIKFTPPSYSEKQIVLALFVLFFSIICIKLVDRSNRVQQAKKVEVEMIAKSKKFYSLIPQFESSKTCLTIPLETNKPIIMEYYEYCPKSSEPSYIKPMKINALFSIDEKEAPRFHFWRKIYTAWESNQFVVHLSDYPEIVLEILELKNPDQYNFNKQWNMVKGTYSARKASYKRFFAELHQKRHLPIEKLPLHLRRIAYKMKHIDEDDKYLIAQRTIRAQRGQKNYVKSGLETSEQYMDHILNTFKEQDVPTELAYIAFVESSFNLLAYSKVGASGVFQIMPATGKQYLRITDVVDERNDPIKAAKAAAKLFKLNHKLTGKWEFALLAYNHGAGNVRKAIRRTNAKTIMDLNKEHTSGAFGFASQNFYYEYLAMYYAIKYAKIYFPDAQYKKPLKFETKSLAKTTPIKSLLAKYDLTFHQFRKLNPDVARNAFRNNAELPRRYKYKVPLEPGDKKYLSAK